MGYFIEAQNIKGYATDLPELIEILLYGGGDGLIHIKYSKLQKALGSPHFLDFLWLKYEENPIYAGRTKLFRFSLIFLYLNLSSFYEKTSDMSCFSFTRSVTVFFIYSFNSAIQHFTEKMEKFY